MPAPPAVPFAAIVRDLGLVARKTGDPAGDDLFAGVIAGGLVVQAQDQVQFQPELREQLMYLAEEVVRGVILVTAPQMAALGVLALYRVVVVAQAAQMLLTAP